MSFRHLLPTSSEVSLRLFIGQYLCIRRGKRVSFILITRPYHINFFSLIGLRILSSASSQILISSFGFICNPDIPHLFEKFISSANNIFPNAFSTAYLYHIKLCQWERSSILFSMLGGKLSCSIEHYWEVPLNHLFVNRHNKCNQNN